MIPFPLTIHQVSQSAPSGALGDTLLRGGDSLGAAIGAVHDTLTPPPLPGGLAAFFRFLFQVPQWIQIGGAVVGLGAGIWLLALIWRRRRRILSWLKARSRQVQIGLAALVLSATAIAGLVGAKGWDYMQHENAFCTGCHIMERPFQRFATLAGRHDSLKCHDCHQQSIFASTRQMVLWVAERPEKIGMHAAVPNARCEGCHQQGGRERWEHVRRLAGHRVHFESDSTVLAGLACVKCHGAEVHRFLPSTRACQQSGCHEQQSIRMAGMAHLPEISCVTCHNFTADLPGLATRDSAVRALVPAKDQCQTCHQMRLRPSGYVAAKDPHRGSCGSCHNVHSDSLPSDAAKSCRGCHTNLASSAFHTGANHQRVQDQCLTCHKPHAASVDPSDCTGCHNDVRRRGLFKPPIPFDTAAVLRQRPIPTPGPSAFGPMERGPSAEEPEASGDVLPPVRASPSITSMAPTDSFAHARHRSLPCLTCHLVNRPRAGLVFEIPRGCDLCHHQQAVAGRVERQGCMQCHRAEALSIAYASEVRVTMPSRTPAVRMVGFEHGRHGKLACAQCHVPPSVTPPDSIRTCSACHDQHHAPERTCAACHNREETVPAHARRTHVECDACHTQARIADLVPTRNFCLTCHRAQQAHQPSNECTPCHFLETPLEFKRQLTRRVLR